MGLHHQGSASPTRLRVVKGPCRGLVLRERIRDSRCPWYQTGVASQGIRPGWLQRQLRWEPGVMAGLGWRLICGVRAAVRLTLSHAVLPAGINVTPSELLDSRAWEAPLKALVYHGPGQKSWDTVEDPAWPNPRTSSSASTPPPSAAPTCTS